MASLGQAPWLAVGRKYEQVGGAVPLGDLHLIHKPERAHPRTPGGQFLYVRPKGVHPDHDEVRRMLQLIHRHHHIERAFPRLELAREQHE
jgi:hypothetical protein